MTIAPTSIYDTPAVRDICENCPLDDCVDIHRRECPLRRWRLDGKRIAAWWAITEA
jgi:hypothetical protein